MATKERVKTYRVLRDGMRVGNSVRNFGDFMPEAKSLPTFRTLLNTNLVEEVWVDQEEYEEWEEDQKKRDEALLAGVSLDDGDEDADAGEEGSGEDAEPTPASSEKVKKPKKKVAKKTTTKKKTVKKGNSSGRKLEERSV